MSIKSDQSSSDSFVKGAFILGISGIFIKIVGAFFRIPLANLLGPEGMSYYSSAYPIYNFFIVLGTAGLPTALAKIISEQRAMGDFRNLDRTFKSGMMLMTSIGFVGSIFMFFGAEFIVDSINNPQSIFAFKALAPAILLVSVMAVYRGFFQGFQEMTPFASSQIFEQFARVIVGYGLAMYLIAGGLDLAAGGATFGATTGAIAGLVVIFFAYRKFRKRNKISFDAQMSGHLIPHRTLIKRIVLIAIPITMGAAVMPLMNAIDVLLVMNRLTDIGMGEHATELYGMLSGYAQTLVNLPQAVTAAIQISIVPAVATLFVQKSVHVLDRTIQNGIRMALIVTLPATAGLVILSKPIMVLLYPSQIQYANTTGSILSILGFSVVFLGLFQVTTGILQGLGMQNRPTFNLFIGAVVKVILTYVLVGITSINIYGAAFSTLVAYGTATTLNFVTMSREANINFDFKTVLLKPLISVFVMSLVVVSLYHGASEFISPKIATVISIFIGIAVYGFMLVKTKTLTDEDFALMPGGKKIKRLMTKFKRK